MENIELSLPDNNPDPTDDKTEGAALAIKSVGKAMAILEELRAAQRPLRIVDLARKLRLTSSAVSRIVKTMASGGLVEQDPQTGRLYLGFNLTLLGQAALGRRDLDHIAKPVLSQIAASLRDKVHYVSLGRLYQGQVIYLRSRSTEMFQHSLDSVTLSPMHATASGKLIAAWSEPDEVVRQLSLRPMDRLTPSTVTNISEFMALLPEVKSNGCALDNRELIADLRHIATPIFGHNGQIVGALSTGGSALSIGTEALAYLAPLLANGCLQISRQIGYEGEYPAVRPPRGISLGI